MCNATHKAVVDSFSAVLNREPAAIRKTMTYDQGCEMHGHKILPEHTGVRSNLQTRTALPDQSHAPKVSHMPDEERRIIKALLDGMIIKYQTKQMMGDLSS